MVGDEEEIISAETNTKQSSSPVKIASQDLEKPLSVRRIVVRKVETVQLSRFELDGLEAMVKWLQGLPVGKRNVPKDILEPDELLTDARVI